MKYLLIRNKFNGQDIKKKIIRTYEVLEDAYEVCNAIMDHRIDKETFYTVAPVEEWSPEYSI